jgi:signal transduction histidine kinase
VLDRGVPRFSADGVFSGYIGSCIDITDRKQSQDRMLASQTLESLGVMAAGIANDFGNLLSTIQADADLALSEMDADSPGRDGFHEITAISVQASKILELLMASAGARSSDRFEALDLSIEVEQILRVLKVSISKRATVRTNLASDLPAVRGSVTQIQQIVMNLITNASPGKCL